MHDPAKRWMQTLANVIGAAIVTDTHDNIMPLSLDLGIERLRDAMRFRTTYLVGNGGSLAIAAHMATDFNLAGLRSIALVDPIALTSHANDFGVAMFTKQLEMLARPNDVLIALSCSGKSPNMIDAARFAHANGMSVITFTGFEPDNQLRLLGALNFFIPARQYGFVQLAHEAILHAACDLEAWGTKHD